MIPGRFMELKTERRDVLMETFSGETSTVTAAPYRILVQTAGQSEMSSPLDRRQCPLQTNEALTN